MTALSTTTAEMDPIDLLIEIAEVRDWPHVREGDYDILINRTTSHTKYTLLVKDDGEGIIFVCLREFHCPSFAELELYRLTNLLNNCITPGTLIYSRDHNTIAYKTTLDFSDERPLTSEEIEHQVDVMIGVCEDTYYCFETVAGHVQLGAKGQDPACSLEVQVTAEIAFTLFMKQGIGHA